MNVNTQSKQTYKGAYIYTACGIRTNISNTYAYCTYIHILLFLGRFFRLFCLFDHRPSDRALVGPEEGVHFYTQMNSKVI